MGKTFSTMGCPCLTFGEDSLQYGETFFPYYGEDFLYYGEGFLLLYGENFLYEPSQHDPKQNAIPDCVNRRATRGYWNSVGWLRGAGRLGGFSGKGTLLDCG